MRFELINDIIDVTITKLRRIYIVLFHKCFALKSVIHRLYIKIVAIDYRVLDFIVICSLLFDRLSIHEIYL